MLYKLVWIIGVIVGIIFAIVTILDKENKSRISDSIFILTAGSIVFGVILFIITFLADGIITIFICDSHYEYQWSSDISAMSDSTGLHGGRWVINSGTDIKYVEDSNGGKEIKTVDANFCTIYEDGENKVDYFTEIRDSKLLNKLFGYTFFSNDNDRGCYEIHIPKGSVTTDFNVDLNN